MNIRNGWTKGSPEAYTVSPFKEAGRIPLPELRKDPVIDQWVIISAERASRPNRYEQPRRLLREGPCPFCSGNEAMTPPEILAIRPDKSEANRPGWTVRVVPNKFPALIMQSGLERRREGTYELTNGFGVHEVIIETLGHITNMALLDEKQLENVFWVYRRRILDLKKDKRLRYIQIFKNQGVGAGATIEHAHSQLIALPMIPAHVMAELNGARKYYRNRGRCVYCDMVRQELKGQSRVVSESKHFLIMCPFASRFPFETWILPKRHSLYFEYGSKQEYADLARCLKMTLIRLNRLLNDPPLNYVIHSYPVSGSRHHSRKIGKNHYHWHIEITPRLTELAGFEHGSGFYINIVPPEGSALTLREIAL